jgi:RecB family exonuclease
MPSRTKNPETTLTKSGDVTNVSDSAISIEDVKPLTDLAKFGGRGDSKLLLSEAAIGKIKRRSLSPSTADAMTGCSARWAIEQLLPRHEDPFGAAELGSSGHRVFEIIFDMPKEERTVTAALDIIGKLQHDVEGKLAIPTDPNDLDRWHNCVTKTVTGLWAIENPREIDVVGLELHLNGIEIADGVPFNGYIDRLREDADGGEIVGDFKGLALDTPLPTPDGWTTMGDVEPGDHLIGSNGYPVLVTNKSKVHDRDCYEMNFSDGSTIVCDNVHIWVVNQSGKHGAQKLSMTELYERFKSARAMPRPTSFSIRNGDAILGQKTDLPIDPWILGAWLGDGSSNTGDLTIGRSDLDDMLAIIEEKWGESNPAEWSMSGDSAANVALKKPLQNYCGRGHSDWKSIKNSKGYETRKCKVCSSTYPIHGCEQDNEAPLCGFPAVHCPEARHTQDAPIWNVPLRTKLHALDLLGNKHVPDVYLRASVEQRLGLLRGLMDTDGYWHPVRKQAVFTNTNLNIANAVAEIVTSFGVNMSRHTVVSKNPSHRNSYRVAFTPVSFNPFLLPRKSIQCAETINSLSSAKLTRALNKRITDIRMVPRVATRCITVDAPDSLFLCGETMIPTHNTGKVPNKRYGDKHGDQIRAYGLARAAMEGCSMPVSGEVLYSQHEELHVVDFSPSAMEATGEKFSTAWRTLNKQTASAEFSTKIGALCGWCPAVDVCPAAIKDGKVARKEGMLAGELLGIGETSVSVSISAKPEPAGQEPASRGTSSTKTNETKEAPMYEPKPWEESNDDGSLNFASYAATGAFGIVEIAVDVLHSNEQEVSSKTVKALSETIQHIIENVYVGLGEGNVSFQAGRHTRLRGAVRTALETITIPFGENEDEWDKWVKRATVRTNAIAKTAISLWENEERVERPWAVLATKEASDDFADA